MFVPSAPITDTLSLDVRRETDCFRIKKCDQHFRINALLSQREASTVCFSVRLIKSSKFSSPIALETTVYQRQHWRLDQA